MVDDKKQQAQRVAAENGILNPSGAFLVAAAPMYLALIPLTSYLTKPDSITQSLTHALIKLIPSIGATSITSGRAIPALSALYLFWTFGASGAASAAGQAMGREEGFDNDHPRKHVTALDGLPLRLRSAHYALMENFPGFALAAALAQVIAPNDAQVVNLLGFHIIAKLLVHYPAYLGNVALPRTFAHLSATAALINVCWRLAGNN
ncbi:Nn.00g075520.m01.CDS01 [Neocucurbitaria sp. VM-36]